MLGGHLAPCGLSPAALFAASVVLTMVLLVAALAGRDPAWEMSVQGLCGEWLPRAGRAMMSPWEPRTAAF